MPRVNTVRAVVRKIINVADKAHAVLLFQGSR
jgi:hypothetical protein